MNACPCRASRLLLAAVCGWLAFAPGPAVGAEAPLAPTPGVWVKLTPLAETPVSPRLGYEGACVWDGVHRVFLRYGGHNQGGGGEQGSEVWTCDPRTLVWKLHEPNTSPPGICCGQQNLFEPLSARYLRFPAFSNSHGWQWEREVYLNDASAWTYDLPSNRWRNMQPYPTVRVSPLRAASWDAEHQVAVLFGGEGNQEGTVVYDPAANTWTRMRPPEQPAFRSGGNMAYDARHRVHILFGSQFDDDRHTWAYDLRTNRWRDLRPETMPPTDKNDAVLTYDEQAGRIVAIIKITEGKDDEARHRLETWTFDVAANRWEAVRPAAEPDPSGSRARQLLFAPELGVTLLENCTSKPREQQLWAFRAVPPRAPELQPPGNLRLSTGPDAIHVSWEPSPSPAAAWVAIERAEGERPWELEYRERAVVAKVATFIDREVAAGKRYHYRLRTVAGQPGQPPAADAMRSAPGIARRAQPKLVEDLVVSVIGPREVELRWEAPGETDLRGYFVERAAVEVVTDHQMKSLRGRTAPLEEPAVVMIRRVGAFRRLHAEPLTARQLKDFEVDLARPAVIEGDPIYERTPSKENFDPEGRGYRFGVYAYRVRGVNMLGTEGGDGPARWTIPGSPEQFFAREQGTTCELKWAARPEQGLRGYRVYRMDGRFSKEPISRLTPDPIRETTFADATAGKSTRRYYVLAVDALGQEGAPSSPVWFEREWKPFYTPFVGEWRQ